MKGLPKRYQPGPLLGEGGMGRVYQARDVVLDTDVAIKVVRADLARDTLVRGRFELEVRISARLVHPNLVPLHDLGTLSDGTPFMAMAMANGGSLLDFAGTWEELLPRVLEVLSALGALHARGVMHRDVKPANVLLHDGRAWLADLGLAEVADALAMGPSRTVGTPAYMAPEQAGGQERNICPATDLYSVGVMLAELTERMDVPEGLGAILEHLRHPHPAGRYDLAADLVHALQALGPPASGGVLTGGSVAPRRSTFDLSAAAGVPEPAALLGIPAPGAPPFAIAWNRPAPAPLPAAVPPEWGLGARARASLPLFNLRDVPLVGRDGLRQRLWDLARSVIDSGRPQVAIVLGEAGAGKTHLVGSIARTLEERGRMETIKLVHSDVPRPDDGYVGAIGRLYRPQGEVPTSVQIRLDPWFRRDYGAAGSGRAALLARWFGRGRPDGSVDPAYGLEHLWDRMRSRSWRGGTLVWIEDAQWASPRDGLALAASLLAQAGDAEPVPALVVITVRTEGLSPLLATRLGELFAAGAHRIDLSRLDREGTAAMLAETLSLDEELAHQVAARCEGNPLFARQLLLHWAEAGELVDMGGLRFGLRPGATAADALPPDAERLFRQRIQAALDDAPDPGAAAWALSTLALAGQAVPAPVARAVAGSALWTLGAKGLLRRDGEQRRWTHQLLHATAVRLAEQRPDVDQLHRAVADAWLQYAVQTGQAHDDRVGEHLLAAGDAERAVGHLLRACEEGRNHFRTDQLLHLGRAAIDAADRCPEGPAADAHRAWARRWAAWDHLDMGDLDSAEHLAGQALALFEGLDHPRGRGEALRTLALIWQLQGQLDKAKDAIEQALQCFWGEQDDGGRMAVVMSLGSHALLRGDPQTAQLHFADAAEAYGRLGDRLRQARATTSLAQATWRTGDAEQTLQLLREALVAFEELGSLYDRMNALRLMGGVHTARGAMDSAEICLEEAQQLAIELGAVAQLADLRATLGDIYRRRGELDRAEALYRGALNWGLARGVASKVAVALLNLGLVALARGSADGCLEHAQAAEAHLADLGEEHWAWVYVHLLRAAALARKGERMAAEASLHQARRAPPSADADKAWVARILAESAREQGWSELAGAAATFADAATP